MGIGGTIFAVGGVAATTWLLRDGYACLPSLQRIILTFAAKLLPPQDRSAFVEQLQADIADLWPSEIIRTLIALDTIRAALRLRNQFEARKRSARTEAAKQSNEESNKIVAWLLFAAIYAGVTKQPNSPIGSVLAKNKPDSVAKRMSHASDSWATASSRSDRVLLAAGLIVICTLVWIVAMIPSVDRFCKAVAAAVGLN